VDQRKTAYRSPTINATQVVRIKLARPDVALVDAEAELSGMHGADDNVLPAIKGKVRISVRFEGGIAPYDANQENPWVLPRD